MNRGEERKEKINDKSLHLPQQRTEVGGGCKLRRVELGQAKRDKRNKEGRYEAETFTCMHPGVDIGIVSSPTTKINSPQYYKDRCCKRVFTFLNVQMHILIPGQGFSIAE